VLDCAREHGGNALVLTITWGRQEAAGTLTTTLGEPHSEAGASPAGHWVGEVDGTEVEGDLDVGRVDGRVDGRGVNTEFGEGLSVGQEDCAETLLPLEMVMAAVNASMEPSRVPESMVMLSCATMLPTKTLERCSFTLSVADEPTFQ